MLYMIGIIFVVLLKFVIPVLMLWWPIAAVWANYVLDTVDGDILGSLGLSNAPYQLIDKTADYWSYIFMVLVARHWHIRRTVYVLFAYRTIGQVLFFATGNELVFFYFQNFLEPLMLIYVLLIWRAGSENRAYSLYRRHILLIWAIIILYKLWNEWYLHYANIDLSTLLFGVSGN